MAPAGPGVSAAGQVGNRYPNAAEVRLGRQSGRQAPVTDGDSQPGTRRASNRLIWAVATRSAAPCWGMPIGMICALTAYGQRRRGTWLSLMSGESEVGVQLLEVPELVGVGIRAGVNGICGPVAVEVPGHCNRP
jgi:hypothetical protein